MAGVRSNKGEVTTDGYYYQLYTLMYCIDRLRNNEKVREYKIGNALEGFGALDDVVFTATLHTGEKITTAIQVKHSNAENVLDEHYIYHRPKTYLYKYFDSFMEIKGKHSLEQLNQLILWTNSSFSDNIRDWFEDFVPSSDESDILQEASIEGLSYARYRIKKIFKHMFVDNYDNRVQKGNKKHVYKPSAEDWEQFFDRCVFYVNVPNVNGLKSYLAKITGNYFDCFCKLVESCAVRQETTSGQIDRLIKLIKLRYTMDTGPYIKLVFNDLNKLKLKVEELFNNNVADNILRVKAGQDVDCTVARLIAVVENCLAAESKRYLVFSYKVFSKKWNLIEMLVKDSKLIEIGLKCIIISSISNEEIRKVEQQLEKLKTIFVGNLLKADFEDEFDVNCLDDQNKNLIKSRTIKLSERQSATANAIFGEELFRKENYETVLQLYTLRIDYTSALQSLDDEPPLDSNYLPRTAKLISADNTTTDIDLLSQTSFSKLIIYDPPGMGKTTEIIKLCADFRDKYQDHFVVYLHCTVAVSKWENNVLDLISKVVASCDKTKHVIEKIIQLGKVILIMDGYDEVSQKYSGTLNSLVSAIARFKMFKLYIATRLQSKDELKDILEECGLCRLKPISEQDQVTYLKKFWNIQNDTKKKVKEKVEANIRCVISQFKSLKNGRSLIGIPLQIHMIAAIYKDHILSADFAVSESHPLGLIYKEFVEFKFKEHLKSNFNQNNAAHSHLESRVSESLWHYHIVFALNALDNGTQLDEKLVKISDEDHQLKALGRVTQPKAESKKLLWEELQHYGLVRTTTLRDRRPTFTFVHSTYFEFFMAEYLLTYSIEKTKMKQYLLKYIHRNNSPLNLVYRFMDGLLADDDIKINPNRTLLNSNYAERFPVNIPSACSRVHPDKMIEFRVALDDISYADISSIFSTLTVSRLFRMFEVIYDSLQEETKSKIRLCLDHDARSSKCTQQICLFFLRLTVPVISCSRTNSVDPMDTLISVLEILLKKNSDSFVKFYSASIQKESMSLLKLMFEPKSKLLKWFLEVGSQLCVKTCFLEIIRSNNIELLMEMISWMKHNLCTEKIIRFLTENNLLRLFIEHIEIVDNGQAVESVKSIRAEMVLSVYDQCKWVFNQNVPLQDKRDFLAKIRNIKTKSIRSAFKVAFQLTHRHYPDRRRWYKMAARGKTPFLESPACFNVMNTTDN